MTSGYAGRVDQKRPLNRVATMRSLVHLTIVAILILLETPLVEAQELKLGRGHRWVRSHPFWISALTQNEPLFDVADYRGAGLNTLLAWDPKRVLFEKASAANLPIHYHMHQNVAASPDGYVEFIRTMRERYPGINGVMFHDEPRVPQMKLVGEVCDRLRKEFPEALVYSNAMPRGAVNPAKYGFPPDTQGDFYAAYLEQFAKVVRGDVMMIDIYPLGSDGGHSRSYFENLLLVRHWGLDRNVPYWLFIQAYDHGGRKRRPGESDLRFQLFTPLTLGFTGIAYFTYGPAIGPGLIDERKNKTPLYYHAGRANQEVMNLGQSLRFLTSTGIAFVMGRHEENGRLVTNEMPPTPPGGPWQWPRASGKPSSLQNVLIEESGPGRDVLLGFFRDDAGDEYLMVTNLWHEKDHSSAATSTTIRLQFDPQVTAVARLSREHGAPERLSVTEGTLRLRLPGGTGDLLKIRDARFPRGERQNSEG